MYAALQCPARRVAQENALHVPCDHTARSIAQCRPVLYCIANIVQRSVLAAVSPSQVKPSAAASGGTAQRSTEHCQCSNDSKRFSTARAQRYTAHTARGIAQCAALYSPHPQHCTAPSTTLHRAQRAKTRPIAASEPSRLRKGGLLRFVCSISAHENRSRDTRARSLCLKRLSSIFGALGWHF